MIDELALALANVLATVEAYDREQPVQTRLATKHTAMRTAMVGAKAALAAYRNPRVLCLDGEPSPEYVITERR